MSERAILTKHNSEKSHPRPGMMQTSDQLSNYHWILQSLFHSTQTSDALTFVTIIRLPFRVAKEDTTVVYYCLPSVSATHKSPTSCYLIRLRRCLNTYTHSLFQLFKLLSHLFLLCISLTPHLKHRRPKIFNTLCSRSPHLTARQSRQTLRLQVDTWQQISPDSPIEEEYHLRPLPQTLRMSLFLQNAPTAGPVPLPTSAPYLHKLLRIQSAKCRGLDITVT